MRQYMFGVITGFLVGTLFGLSAVANMLFVSGFAADDAVDTGSTAVGDPFAEQYTVEELEFIEGVPVQDPSTIPQPKPGDEIIQPGD